MILYVNILSCYYIMILIHHYIIYVIYYCIILYDVMLCYIMLCYIIIIITGIRETCKMMLSGRPLYRYGARASAKHVK